jgi:hypothetical protein
MPVALVTVRQFAIEIRVPLGGITCQNQRKVKSVPVSTAKDFRELTAAASQMDEWDKLGGEGAITLNVLNKGKWYKSGWRHQYIIRNGTE